MKKKMRKFANGGYSTVDPENPVPSINDDTRNRAMKFVENASEESRDIGAPVTRSAAKSTSKVSQTVTPPKTDMEAEKARMDSLVKKQALERVEPENYIPGPGMIKNLFKMGAQRLAKNSADDVASAASRVAKNDAAEIAVRNRAAKVRGEANDAASTAVRTRANKVQSEANDAAEIAVRNRAAKVRGKDNDAASKSVRERASKLGLKSGGSVSSASRRADGCCIRGKTRA
jgi:hypothetical protein